MEFKFGDLVSPGAPFLKNNEDMKTRDLPDLSDRILLGICKWWTDRVSESVMIAILMLGALIAAFNV